jgi:ubiquinone biosynthesis protein
VPGRGALIAWTLTRHAVAGWRLSPSARREASAVHLRRAFEDLGPAFIKLGQLMSVRPDVFGPEIVFEMEKLCDSVPSLPSRAIREVIERELGDPDRLFASFDDAPLASASIAQVHRATLAEAYRPVIGAALPAGAQLVVKVVKPGVEEAIRSDIAAARPLVAWLSRRKLLRRYNLASLLDEFAASLSSECDLREEARVADRFSFDFRDDPLVLIPRIVWPRTSRRVLTMEYVEGWRLSELTAAEREGIDARGLALHGSEVFMRQVLVLGRFHADLHPANVFVTPDGRIAYLDFGIVGRTERENRAAIAQVLAATVYGDADRALKYSAQLGLAIDPAREPGVRRAVGELMDRTLGASPRDVRGFAIGFLRVMHDAGVSVPVGFGLLVKALVTVEGVAKALYPDMDITDAAKPYATKLIAQQMLDPATLWRRMPDAMRAAMRELAG